MTKEKEKVGRTREVCDELAEDVCRAEGLSDTCVAENRLGCYKEFGVAADPRIPLLYLAHVRFEAARDETLLQKLNALPTRLQLPPEDIDLLIREAPPPAGEIRGFPAPRQ